MADTTYYDLPYPASTDKVSLGYKNIQDLAEQIDAILYSANLPIVGNTATVLRSDTAFTSAVTGTYNSLVLNTAVPLPNGMTATTQAQSDGSTKVATTAYVDSYITGTVPDGSITTAKLAAGAVTNVKVDAAAAIAYSKLNLASSITSSDIVDGTIVNADVNAAAGITYAKLSLTGGIVNADVNASAAISYSKLNLATSIVNADVSASAAIAYSKLALTGAIVNADLAGSIAPSKITGTAVVTADSRLSDARTPTAHAGTHIPGGTDVLDYTKIVGYGTALPTWSATTHPAGVLWVVNTVGEPYSLYRSDGVSAWKQVGGGGASVTASDTAPSSPTSGALWFDSTTGKTFIWYVDGSSNQWVEVGEASQLSIPTHGSSHVRGGSDVIDGDRVSIDFVPSRYTRNAAASGAGDVTDLTANLSGIDTSLNSLWVPPMVRLTKTATQTISSTTDTLLTWATPASYDTNTMYTSSSTVTIQTTGVYSLVAGCSWATNATNRRVIYITKNGTGYADLLAGSNLLSVGGSPLSQVTSVNLLTAGDVLRVYVYQDSGVSLNVPASTNSYDTNPTFFAVTFLGKTA